MIRRCTNWEIYHKDDLALTWLPSHWYFYSSLAWMAIGGYAINSNRPMVNYNSIMGTQYRHHFYPSLALRAIGGYVINTIIMCDDWHYSFTRYPSPIVLTLLLDEPGLGCARHAMPCHAMAHHAMPRRQGQGPRGIYMRWGRVGRRRYFLGPFVMASYLAVRSHTPRHATPRTAGVCAHAHACMPGRCA